MRTFREKTINYYGIPIVIRSSATLIGHTYRAMATDAFHVGFSYKRCSVRVCAQHTIIYCGKRIDSALTMPRARKIAREFCRKLSWTKNWKRT